MGSPLPSLDATLFVLVRVLPSCVLLTLLTRGVLGWTVALSLALALAVGLSPGLASADLAGQSLGALLSLLMRELCLGALVALALLLPVAAAGWSARFGELSAGLRGPRAGPLSTLYPLAAGALALALGLHRSLVVGLNESLAIAAPAAVPLDRTAFALGAARLVAEAFALALALAIPLLASTLLLTASMAVVARLLGRRGREPWAELLEGPGFVLVAGLLAMPAVTEVPAALRVGLRLLRELARDAGT